MSSVLINVPNCDAYLDDVCYSDSWDEHVKLLDCVFACLEKANLTLNLAKCEFACATVSYLGKEVGNSKVRPLGSKIQVILDFPVSMTKRELWRFLGMATIEISVETFRMWLILLQGCSEKVFLSNERTSACQFAFEALKTLLFSTPVFSAPRFDRAFKLEVDASDMGAGAMLIQTDDAGIEHPNFFFFNKFLKHQLN